MSKFLNQKYQRLVAYTPGEQPQDMQYIKLNTNESPYPPSKSVCDAINANEASQLRLYCDPECKQLKISIANLYGVKPENVYLSNGSDDILNFVFMAYSSKHTITLFPEISYGFYKVFADLYGNPYKAIPLNDDFTINADDYCSANGLVVIANPNAPTGITLSLSDIEKIVSSNSDNIVVIDEAYVDFGAQSCYKLTSKYKNLLVVQTFSKSRSMAGARLGFAIADSEIINDLERIKYSTNPYNVNRLTQIAGINAIADNDYYMQNCKKIIETRCFVTNELEKLGFEVLPSKANFVFAKSSKIKGKEFYQKLKSRGILVRHFDTEKICDYNRITIGSPEDMKTFVKTVKQIVEEK